MQATGGGVYSGCTNHRRHYPYLHTRRAPGKGGKRFMQQRMGNGRAGPARGNGRSAAQPDAGQAGPKTLRATLHEFKLNAQGTVAGVPRAWKLVWETHKGFTI